MAITSSSSRQTVGVYTSLHISCRPLPTYGACQQLQPKIYRIVVDIVPRAYLSRTSRMGIWLKLSAGTSSVVLIYQELYLYWDKEAFVSTSVVGWSTYWL